MGWLEATSRREQAYTVPLRVNKNLALSEAQGRLIMNCPLDRGLRERVLCNGTPRMKDPYLQGEFLEVVRGWGQGKGMLLAR